MYLVTSEEMNELDRRTITSRRIPGILLMEHAGKAVAEAVLRCQPTSVVVLCGKGNNGGDGWIAARWLNHWQACDVSVVSLVEPSSLQGDAATAAEMALAAGVAYEVYRNPESIPEADLFVDALLGTGVSRPVSGALADLMNTVNQRRVRVVSVDVPSGVNASTGGVEGAVLQADLTVAMTYAKVGTMVTPGCLYAGTVQVADIGIAPMSEPGLVETVDGLFTHTVLPVRGSDVHKGTFGKVGVTVGEMTGASVLAGLGAARVGAGLVVLGGPAFSPLTPVEFVLRNTTRGQTEPLSDCHVLVVGPGLGERSMDWKNAVTSHSGTGVLDADGLMLCSLLRERASRWVLTPHPKECGRLLGWSTESVQAQRVKAARTLSAQQGAVVVLKGFRSIVAHPDGRLRIICSGDASLATAGTGDVLAGMVGGLLAQGLSPFDAAAAGAYLHGVAGELAGQLLSQRSVLATDVVDQISCAIRQTFDTRSEVSP